MKYKEGIESIPFNKAYDIQYFNDIITANNRHYEEWKHHTNNKHPPKQIGTLNNHTYRRFT